MKKILVPTDFNRLATAALQFAVPLARAAGAEITVLYADTFVPPAEFTATQMHDLTAALETSRSAAATELDHYAHEHVPEDLQIHVVVREALPVDAIVDAARDADLIVMGTHGRGPLSRILLGSVAHGVTQKSDKPVLTITNATRQSALRRVLADPSVEPFAREFASIIGASVSIISDEGLVCGEGDVLVIPRSQRANLAHHVHVPVLSV